VSALLARWATPTALLLTLVAWYCAPEAGAFGLAALCTWALALTFTT